MPDQDESTGKSKGGKPPEDDAGVPTKAMKEGRLLSDELETIPTAMPREGDGYRLRPSDAGGIRYGCANSISDIFASNPR